MRAFVQLVRPRHMGQVVGTVAVLSIMSHGVSAQSATAIMSSLFVSIAVFLLDDAHDYESDRITHPERPISKGLITARHAYLASATLMSIGISLAFTLPPHQLAIFLSLVATSTAVIFVNFPSIIRAFIIAFLIFGLFPFSAFPNLRIMIFGLITALPHVGGSIAKDFLHSSGDQLQGLKPPPHWAKYVASSAFILTGVIVWFPVILISVSWFYMFPSFLTFMICIMLGASTLREKYQRVYTYGKIGMVSTLIAFLAGEV